MHHVVMNVILADATLESGFRMPKTHKRPPESPGMQGGHHRTDYQKKHVQTWTTHSQPARTRTGATFPAHSS